MHALFQTPPPQAVWWHNCMYFWSSVSYQYLTSALFYLLLLHTEMVSPWKGVLQDQDLIHERQWQQTLGPTTE